MLEVKNLEVEIGNNKVLKGINLTINSGEIHVIMGPNGSGKSSLASSIVGHPNFNVVKGDIIFENQSIIDFNPETRACEGIFMSFQHPIEIPGITNSYFIRTALNLQKEYRNEDKVSSSNFLKILETERKKLDLDKKLLKRQVNFGFSGGEKKCNEILQMAILKPKLAILDEIDSGLDVDALKIIGQNIKRLHKNDNSMLIITHYPRILQYVDPDFVHILKNGQIIQSGDKNLAYETEKSGYFK